MEKLQLTKANTYNTEYKLYQLFQTPNMSVDMQDSYNPLGKPTISRGGGFEGGLQGLRVTEQHHKHNSQTKIILINAKSLKNFYNFDISLQNTYQKLIIKFNIFLNIIKVYIRETKKKNNIIKIM